MREVEGEVEDEGEDEVEDEGESKDDGEGEGEDEGEVYQVYLTIPRMPRLTAPLVKPVSNLRP